ncbi:MAG TPA: THUMP domain-containing protein, partial [Candidatus Dormibacteraeota bacterium]|nr:THUMP domain-containing protein [Candidatus Dormibacteraeota bacterium]
LSKAAEPVVLVASSEFILKSSAVRRTLEQRLIDDLKFALRRENLDCSRVEKEAARFVVFGTKQNELAAAVCRNVFGVAYAAPAVLLTNPTMEDIVQAILELARQRLVPGKSFAIRAHRSTYGVVSRHGVELEGGSMILRAFKDREVSVDLDDPDLTFYVDLVSADAYVYSQKLNGPGGLPLSAKWRTLAVLDSGPLSVLAALAMMRRGCVVELFIPVSNTIARLSSETQLALARRVGRLVTRPNYKAFLMDIDGSSGRGHMVNAGWRDFVRASAVKFARENRFRGLIFGEISGHLSSLGRYSGLSSLPIFYPLLGLDEEDLAELSRLVGLDAREPLLDWGSGVGSYASQSEMKSLVEELSVPTVREVEF